MLARVYAAAVLAFAVLLSGCASETVKVVEGTDLSVGFTIPGMETKKDRTSGRKSECGISNSGIPIWSGSIWVRRLPEA